jgi:hypothetical protein
LNKKSWFILEEKKSWVSIRPSIGIQQIKAEKLQSTDMDPQQFMQIVPYDASPLVNGISFIDIRKISLKCEHWSTPVYSLYINKGCFDYLHTNNLLVNY